MSLKDAACILLLAVGLTACDPQAKGDGNVASLDATQSTVETDQKPEATSVVDPAPAFTRNIVADPAKSPYIDAAWAALLKDKVKPNYSSTIPNWAMVENAGIVAFASAEPWPYATRFYGCYPETADEFELNRLKTEKIGKLTNWKAGRPAEPFVRSMPVFYDGYDFEKAGFKMRFGGSLVASFGAGDSAKDGPFYELRTLQLDDPCTDAEDVSHEVYVRTDRPIFVPRVWAVPAEEAEAMKQKGGWTDSGDWLELQATYLPESVTFNPNNFARPTLHAKLVSWKIVKPDGSVVMEGQ